MKLNRLLIYAIISTTTLSLYGCSGSCDCSKKIIGESIVEFITNSNGDELGEYEINLEPVIIRKYRSYIPINIQDRPSNYVNLIMDILEKFQDEHPSLGIYNWKIKKQQDTKTRYDTIFGIWVDHAPR